MPGAEPPARLAYAVADRPDAFAPKVRWAMDWYYPVLTGALIGDAATRRMQSRWEELVVPGSGARCVADKSWVTAAESAECAMAAARAGWRAEAVELCWRGRGIFEPMMVAIGPGASTRTACGSLPAKKALIPPPPSLSLTMCSTSGPLAAAIFSEGRPPGGWSSKSPAYDAGSPNVSTADSTSLAARRPEPMHAGTPTPL